jgi:hypothetical protein
VHTHKCNDGLENNSVVVLWHRCKSSLAFVSASSQFEQPSGELNNFDYQMAKQLALLFAASPLGTLSPFDSPLASPFGTLIDDEPADDMTIIQQQLRDHKKQMQMITKLEVNC